MVSHNPTCSRKGCRSVNPLILVVLLWTSGRGTWIIGHLILIYIHESATANAPLTINGVPSLRGGPWSHIRHTPFLAFLDTCFLIFLAPLFAVWLASDFVPTLQIETVTLTHKTSPACDLCNVHDIQDEQHVLFLCTHPHVVYLRRTYASLFLPQAKSINDVSAFLGRENNKLYFFTYISSCMH